MVGSRRVKVQSGELQTSTGTLDEGLDEYADWEEEREMERVACEEEDFMPPKIMLISSKVPKAEYVPNIIRRDDPSIIPILYDHEHATFDDILEEIEKKLTAYRKGCKIWNMLIFCQV
ncbi:NMDA receptor synaptonuclear signaling and neuronal migration factor-like, partial [Notothenia coriiceps]|uniref:NMDA receptor synaptonuclear signaling and neuronal migration factor-like n=1 Tax=Notothenia coriiceps TaxID=8208 RepID=A0A6I9NIQ0_9TELE